MPWWALACVGVFGGAVLVSCALLAVVAARMTRGLQRVKAVATPIDELVTSVEALESRLAGVEAGRERLERRLATLHRSRARLSVLQWALGDTLGFVARVRGAVPRK